MKYNPRFIIYLAVINYLDEDQLLNLKMDLGANDLKSDRKFINVFKKHFNFERFKDHPYIWQDIWLYNYLQYDVKVKLVRSKLIAKYEREIIIPQKKMLEKANDILNNISGSN